MERNKLNKDTKKIGEIVNEVWKLKKEQTNYYFQKSKARYDATITVAGIGGVIGLGIGLYNLLK